MTIHQKIRLIQYATIIVLVGLALYLHFMGPRNSGSDPTQYMIALWCAVLALSCICVYSLKLIRVDTPRIQAEARALAHHVAQRRWYVKGGVMFGTQSVRFLTSQGWEEVRRDVPSHARDAAVLELNSADVERELLQLTLRQGHPSITHLQELHYLDIVEFEETSQPLSCAVEADLCAHLTMKHQSGSST